MTKNIYIISGLGVDERIFQRLDLSDYSTTFIKWILPLDNETIENYTTRLTAQITTPEPILIGLSFGGIIAVEMAKQIETEKVILIASAKTKKEIPFYYRWAGQLRLHRLLPIKLLKNSNFITNWFFGTSSAFDKQLLGQILGDIDPTFLKWAINVIINWKNQTLPTNFKHIHGTSDRILPIRFAAFNIEIKNGGHLMTLNKPEELTAIIKSQL